MKTLLALIITFSLIGSAVQSQNQQRPGEQPPPETGESFNYELLPYVDKKVKEYDFHYAIHNHGPDIELYPDADDIWENVLPNRSVISGE